MNGTQSEVVTDLVQQLKTGQITKAQLFSQLSSLPQSKKNEDSSSPKIVSPRRHSAMPASGFSHVTEQDERLRRRSIIQRVIEEQTFRKSPDLDDPEPIETPVEDDSSLTIEDLVHNDPSDRLELSERRMSRRERNELDIRMSQMSECTFEPTIHELPRHYGIQRDVDIPFHLRMDRWAKRKEAWQTQKQQELLQSELEGCTFTPSINQKSKIVAERRLVNAPDITERLYKDAEQYKYRDEVAEREQKRREEDEKRECTFKPKIKRGPKPQRDSVNQPPRYLQPKQQIELIDPGTSPGTQSCYDIGPEASIVEAEECTFTPKVNQISRHMNAAQEYVQINIYDRLSGQLGKDECDADSDDTPSFRTLQRPSSASFEREDRERKFQRFLMRQEHKAKVKQDRIKQTEKQVQPKLKPTLNRKSMEMMENRASAENFYQRQERHRKRTEKKRAQTKEATAHDPECVFKPRINKKSSIREPRSVTELSRGDMLKKETTQRFLKLKLDRQEMKGMTFKPELNKSSLKSSGKLRLLTEPDTYIQRVQSNTQLYSQRQRAAMQEEELKEFEECTFQPQVNPAPAYVTRIARSMALTKAAREAEEAKKTVRPDWK